MAYIQKNNPIPKTGCGRRRSEQMVNPFKMSKASLNKISSQLKKASKLHAGQAAKIDKATSAMKKEVPSHRIKSKLKPRKTLVGSNYKPKKFSIQERAVTPMKKISGPCKAAAKRKFKVWPSAYASGWGVRCTRNPSKYLKRK